MRTAKKKKKTGQEVTRRQKRQAETTRRETRDKMRSKIRR